MDRLGVIQTRNAQSLSPLRPRLVANRYAEEFGIDTGNFLSWGAPAALSVYIVPFQVHAPMECFRLFTRIGIPSVAQQAAVALYKVDNPSDVNIVPRGRASTFSPSASASTPPLETTLIRAFAPRNLLLSAHSFYEDCDPTFILQPDSIFALGIQVTGAVQFDPPANSNRIVWIGNIAGSAIGVFPPRLRCSLTTLRAPGFVIRSKKGVRLFPVGGES